VPADEIIYARKDWLDALNLDPPRTLEEYYRVMRAFTYEDPDRNGKNDTWGLTIMPAGLSRTAPFFGAFGVPRSDHAIRQWKLRNGELVYSGLLPETLEALRYLARLYGDGILDREFVLNKEAVFAEKITSGRVGLFAARWNETASILQDTLARNPQAEWIRLDYPVGRDGQQGTRQTDLLQAYNVIPAASSAAKARDAIRLLNEIAGPAHRELLLAADPAQFALQAPSSREVVRPADAHSSLYALANPDDPDTRGEWLDSLGEQLALEDNIGYAMEHALHSDFRGLPTPSMGKYADKLQKLEEEAFLKLIMGLEPRNDFDDFTKLWLSEGGWELSKEVNAWYRELGGNGQ
jgi:putative aldouronate transport system substrate-binding protein